MGCSTYLGLGWRYQPLAPGHPTSICDIGVKRWKLESSSRRNHALFDNFRSTMREGEVTEKHDVMI